MDDLQDQDNSFWLPIDIINELKHLIETNRINPDSIVVVTEERGKANEVFSSNLNALETYGLLGVGQHVVINGSVAPSGE